MPEQADVPADGRGEQRQQCPALGEEPVGLGGGGTPIIWLDVADWHLAQRNL